MLDRNCRASSADNVGVFPRLTTCFGPRTEVAGFTGTIPPVVNQSNNMRRKDESG